MPTDLRLTKQEPIPSTGRQEIQKLRLALRTMRELPPELASMPALEFVHFDNCTIQHPSLDAFRQPAKGKVQVVFAYCQVDPEALFEDILANGAGRAKVGWESSTVAARRWKKALLLVQKLGDIALDRPDHRRLLYSLLAEDVGYASPARTTTFPDDPSPDLLELLNVGKTKLRELVLSRLEDGWDDPTPLPPNARLFVAGKPKYYPKEELIRRCESHGWKIAEKANESTHGLIMGSPKRKLDQARAAQLPIVLEVHLRRVFEVEHEEVDGGNEAVAASEGELTEPLLDPDPKRVEEAISTLRSGSILKDELEALAAVMMRHPNAAVRKLAKQAVLTKADDAWVLRFEADHRRYHSITNHRELEALVEHLEAELAFDGDAFVRRMAVLASHPDGPSGAVSYELVGPLSLAVGRLGDDPVLFDHLRHLRRLDIERYSGPMPTGLRRLEKLESLDMRDGELTGCNDTGVLPPSLVDAHFMRIGLDGLGMLTGCPALGSVVLDTVVVDDLGPLARVTGLKRLTMRAVDADLHPLLEASTLEELSLQDMVAPRDLTEKLDRKCKLNRLRAKQAERQRH